MIRRPSHNYLGLDIGDKRVGVARVNSEARIPELLKTLANDPNLRSSLINLIKEHEIEAMVVGLPRSMDGRESSQTEKVRALIEELDLDVDVYFQDETLTSEHATLLMSEKEKRLGHTIDEVAAKIILLDFLDDIDKKERHGV